MPETSPHIAGFELIRPQRPLPYLDCFTTLASAAQGQSTLEASFGGGGGSSPIAQSNRSKLAKALAPTPLTWLALEHACRIRELPAESSPARPLTGDAVILGRRGQAAALTTADCLPIVLVDADPEPCAALIHAGWRGLAAGIIEAVLKRLTMHYRVNPVTLQVWIGPCIHQSDYEIGADAHTELGASPSVAPGHFQSEPERPGHWLADLPGIAQAKFSAWGIDAAHVQVFPESTKSSPALYSVRRDGQDTGRMATVIALR
ncbi:MAG: polyphenol oxidase family protein [Coriobacteriales bacterium]|jgi:YfiH family protein|nr:polyphenol oxidase family protein [Coriobacteriales bacterium]